MDDLDLPASTTIVSSDDGTRHDAGNEHASVPLPENSLETSSLQRCSHDQIENAGDDTANEPLPKRRGIQPMNLRKSNSIQTAQRDIPRDRSGCGTVIVLAPVQSFYRVRKEAYAEASKRTKRNCLDMVTHNALLKSVEFWARILGKDQTYLDFLTEVKYVVRWVEPKPGCLIE